MAGARGKSQSADQHVASEGGSGYSNTVIHQHTSSAQGRHLRSGRPEQRAAANQSPQQIGIGQATVGESADEDISWLALVDLDPLISDFSPASSRTGAVFGAVSPPANSNPVGQRPSPAPASCNTAGHNAQQQRTSSESLCSNSAFAAFDALMRSAHSEPSSLQTVPIASHLKPSFQEVPPNRCQFSVTVRKDWRPACFEL